MDAESLDVAWKVGITGLAVAVVGLLAFIVNKMLQMVRDVGEVNDAVNHRHLRKKDNGETPPKLYDLAIENHQRIDEVLNWKRGYQDAGGELDTGEKVHAFVSDTTERLEHHSKRLLSLEEKMDFVKQKLVDQGAGLDEIRMVMNIIRKRLEQRAATCDECPAKKAMKNPPNKTQE